MNNEINFNINENQNILENIGNIKNSKIYGDDFWINDYKILFNKENLSKFIPNVQMTNVEKLNSIMRLSIYLSLVLYLYSNKK